jgi:hypothetical protein
MTQEPSPPVSPLAPPASRPRQVITGVVPPQLAEALIREAWPTVVGINAGLALLGKKLVRTVFLAPLGFLPLGLLFGLKFAPFVCKRYTLTNRRLMVQHGLKPTPVAGKEVALADIDEVRLDPAGIDPFFVSGTLEVVSKGQVVLTLPGVPEPEGFRQAIINAVKAWVPGKATGPFQSAAAASKPA